MTGTIQFFLSNPAAAVVKLAELPDRCRARGLENARFELSIFRAGDGVQLTCKVSIAAVLLEDLRAAAISAPTPELREECRHGVESLARAIGDRL